MDTGSLRCQCTLSVIQGMQEILKRFKIYNIVWPFCVKTQAQKSLPQVPITYPGDTNNAITRRAQWIEGAKKEGSLVWWGDKTSDEGEKIIAEFN